jgi:hypothetical protein
MENNSIFYGSLYDDEMPTYKEKIEEQFKGCSDHAKKEGLNIVAWGFDVLVKKSEDKKIAEDFVEECAKKYFPGVESVSIQNQKNKK